MVTERRTYTLRKRARAAEDTRQRIIAAAQALFAEAGYPNVSLDDIAARAGVSRQTIYVQFGAKNGVLRAVVEHIEQAQFGDVQAGLQRTTDPVDSVRSGIGIQITFFSAHADLLRTFYAQAAHDPEVRALWQERTRWRLDALRWLFDLIEREGQLAPGWSAGAAADWIWSLISFQVYDMLVNERGWSPQQLEEQVRQAIDMMLLNLPLG